MSLSRPTFEFWVNRPLFCTIDALANDAGAGGGETQQTLHYDSGMVEHSPYLFMFDVERTAYGIKNHTLFIRALPSLRWIRLAGGVFNRLQFMIRQSNGLVARGKPGRFTCSAELLVKQRMMVTF